MRKRVHLHIALAILLLFMFEHSSYRTALAESMELNRASPTSTYKIFLPIVYKFPPEVDVPPGRWPHSNGSTLPIRFKWGTNLAPKPISNVWKIAYSNAMVDWEASTRADFISYYNTLNFAEITYRSDIDNPGWTNIYVSQSSGDTLWVEAYGNTYWGAYYNYTTNQRRGVITHEVGHMLSIGHIPRDYVDPTVMPHIIYEYEFPSYHDTIYRPQTADIVLVNSIYP